MARPGDLVEFRAGLHGLEPPENLGFFLSRERRKGVPWVTLFTLLGRREMKAEHLSRRMFKAGYEGDMGDEAAMRQRLQQLLSRGDLVEEAVDDLDRLEGDLWETCKEAGPLDEETIARRHYGETSPQQLRDVKAALARCRRPGTGRFQVAGRGDTFRAWTAQERQQMESAFQKLARLRDTLVVRVEGTDGPRYEATGAVVSPDLQDTLAWVVRAMVQHVEHDGVSEPVQGIGGLPVVQAFGMDLHRTLGFLAKDIVGIRSATRSSDYIQFLLHVGVWRPADAVGSILRRHVLREPYFDHVPDAAAEAAADALPEPSPQAGRVDLRRLPCMTIDPDDARDFDDAVGLVGDTLYVHIADVSAYVTPDTVLDRHARTRATSVYLPGKVLPMLPRRLADDLCSLRAGRPRYALSVALRLEDGAVAEATFMRSLIEVDENLSYKEALRRSAAGDASMQALMATAESMRRHRRSLAIDTGEIRVQVTPDTFTHEEKRSDAATAMIETFMVAANEAAARFLLEHDLPGLHRCHPLPDPVLTERFAHQLEAMGFTSRPVLPERRGTQAGAEETLLDRLRKGGGIELFGGAVEAGDDVDKDVEDPPGVFSSLSPEQQEEWLAPLREVLAEITGAGPRGEVATWKLLACMGRAYYSDTSDGHYGLGTTAYAHFTSPIRRYPDLVVHRQIAWHLAGREGAMPHAEVGTLADHCSDQERAADGLERRVKAACLVLASLDQGAPAPARITGITPAAVFIRRDDGIEARVPQRELPGGPYTADEFEARLLTRDGGTIRAKLGDAVRVALTGRDVAEGRTSARLEWT